MTDGVERASGTILDACADPTLFAPWFKTIETWAAWRAFLATTFGLDLSAEQLETFRKCTGREAPQPGGYNECWLVCGRRSGKSFVLALIAVFLACFRDWSMYLTPGERGVIMVVASDKKQARVIHRYCLALLQQTPLLASLIENDTWEAVNLSNNISIEIMAGTFRGVRGYTAIAFLGDEIAFWRSDDSANPDTEILNAVRPSMATIPGAMLLCASSPYARRGELWNAYRRDFGKNESPILVWRAPTRTMNPSVPQSFIDEAFARDPANASAEFGAEFRGDIETFVSREAVEACVTPGCFELPPMSGVRYVGFVDPSGGSADSMTLAISHRERDGRVVLDLVRERKPPFSPDAVTAEFANLLRRYRLTVVHGDRYAGEWPTERFLVHGVRYEASEQTKSELYIDALPPLNSGRAVLLDNQRLISQFCGLERRTARSGKDSIDHAPGGHDDVVNAVCGSLVLAARHMPFIATREMVDAIRAAGPRPRVVWAMGRR